MSVQIIHKHRNFDIVEGICT